MTKLPLVLVAALSAAVLSGCVAGTVIDTTATVVGGAVDAVIWTADAVTPDL